MLPALVWRLRSWLLSHRWTWVRGNLRRCDFVYTTRHSDLRKEP